MACHSNTNSTGSHIQTQLHSQPRKKVSQFTLTACTYLGELICPRVVTICMIIGEIRSIKQEFETFASNLQTFESFKPYKCFEYECHALCELFANYE